MAAVEIVARVERRRKWTSEEKAALLAELEATGDKVAVVARRHRMSQSLLYNWRSAWKTAAAMRAREPLSFVPIGVLDRAPDDGVDRTTRTAGRLAGRPGMIEIELPSGARLRVDAHVNEPALRRVLQAIKGAV